MKNKKYLCGIVCVVLLFCSMFNVYATETGIGLSGNKNTASDKVICTATLEDDFADDTVLVVINKEYSKRDTVFTASHFPTIQVAEVRSITSPIGDLFTESRTAEEAEKKANTLALTNVEEFRQIIEVKLKNPGKENVLKAIKELEKIDYIESAEPNYYYEVDLGFSGTNQLQTVTSTDKAEGSTQRSSTLPNDYNSSVQYALEKINAPGAWDITTGSKEIRVGIIDSGISNHTDLSANLVFGWDFVNNHSTTTDDPIGHGTHVAGIIGAKGNNGIGICGVNWNVSLVPLQVIYYDSTKNKYHFSSTAIQSAVEHARINNISIINCSFGGMGTSSVYAANMMSYTGLIVCSAGNGDDNGNPYNTDVDSHEPSCFPFDHIISVAATTQNDTLRSSSNYGATTVDLGAPGDDIKSTVSTSNYANKSGTSMAAPHVTGVAALIKSIRPDLNAVQIKSCILNGVDKVSALTNKCVSEGRLNAYKAVQLAVDFPMDQMVSGDFDGDGKDDVAYITDAGLTPKTMKVYVRKSGNGTRALWSTETNFNTAKVADRVVAGDFNNDGKDDLALMYDNSDAKMRIHVLLSTGSSFRSRSSWFVQENEGMYNANRATGRVTAGDFNGDGKDDVSAMYDNGDGKMRIHMFLSSGSGFTIQYWYEDMVGRNFYASGVTGRFEAGDYNGDGKDDIAAMYGYADGRTRTHVWLSNGTSLNQRTAWFIQDTPYYYNTQRVNNRFEAGDYNGDGKDDIATLYEYENGTMMLHVFTSQTNTYSWWQNWYHSSVEGSFYANSVKAFSSGDYNGDGKGDILLRYVYQAGYSNLLQYQSAGSSFTYLRKFSYE